MSFIIFILAGLEEAKRNSIDEEILLNSQNLKANNRCVSSVCCHSFQVPQTSSNDLKHVTALMNDIVKRLDSLVSKFGDVLNTVFLSKPSTETPAPSSSDKAPVNIDDQNLADMSAISYDDVDPLNYDVLTNQAPSLMH